MSVKPLFGLPAVLIFAAASFILPAAEGPRCGPGAESQARQAQRGLPPAGQRRPRPSEREPAALEADEIAITVGGPDGTIKPLLGVNAGPVPSGEKGNADVTSAYKACGVTAVRTHDFYGPLDLSVIFPDPGRTPGEAGALDFSASDPVFRAILDGGFEPYLRLGDSYNNIRVPRGSAERTRLAQAAAAEVRHYRTGPWAGSASRWSRVEIGNEPDFNRFWPSGFEDFLPFYAETFVGLRSEFPDLRIGGPGFVVASYKIPDQRRRVGMFLEYLKVRNIRPDFLSYHVYSNDPAEYYDAAQFYRQACRRAGWEKTEIHLTEWNTEQDMPEYRLGDKAAPYATAIWIALQRAGVDAAFLYRGTDTSIRLPSFFGLFKADGREKPAAKAFKLWSAMTGCASRLSVRTGLSLIDDEPRPSGGLSPLWVLAGREPGGACLVLLANIGRREIRCVLKVPALVNSMSVTEIRAPGASIDSRLAAGPRLVLAPLSVQMVRIE
jgi:hypothetical protein